MSFPADKLYALLPAIHRIRDAEEGEPLRQLIEVIAGQVAVLEENLAQLYDNNFVETAAPWALPYIGDLLGIRGLSGSGTLTRMPRSEVGHTIAYRRRKGTAAILELLARDVTSWLARAVEFFERLATTQHFNHIRIANRAFTSVRSAEELEFFGTAFESATRTVEVRSIETSGGKWNIPNVGVFLWRLTAYALTRTPLAATQLPVELADNRHFRFHPLGFDLRLFSNPVTEDKFTHLAEPINVAMPISRRMLKGDEYAAVPNQFHPSADYYGVGRSIRLEKRVSGSFQDVAGTEILVADLSDTVDGSGKPIWAHEALGQSESKVLLDPMQGRVVFPTAEDNTMFATFYRGFSADTGGGEYNRSSSFDTSSGSMVEVANTDASKPATIEAGLATLGTGSGVVEIMDSSRYEEVFTSIDATSRQVEIRAGDGRSPTLLLDQPVQISGDADGVVTLNGLLISGQALEVKDKLGRLRLRHCTIVPLLKVDANGTATLDSSPALTVNSDTTVVEIENCIIGPIHVGPDITVQLKNSIVDAVATTNVALSDVAGAGPAGTWSIENCTVRGKVNVSVLELASNSIFSCELAPGDDPAVWPVPFYVQRRQEGCVRFSWLPPDCRAPRRYECLPRAVESDVRPDFTSLRFGDAAYAQLGPFCPEAISSGADEGAEMGVFHDLLQPQRKAQLVARLGEYLRFGLGAGIFDQT